MIYAKEWLILLSPRGTYFKSMFLPYKGEFLNLETGWGRLILQLKT